MHFQFYIQALNGKELEAKISTALEQFFPASNWSYTLEEVTQTEQNITNDENKGKKKGQPLKVLFQVKVEVFPRGLKNAVVKIDKYSI